jgi:NAD-dependent dihydropyrimidine dehydrogenase PreA subunit
VEDAARNVMTVSVKISAPLGICMNGMALSIRLPKALRAPMLAMINNQAVLLNQSNGWLCFPCVINCMNGSITFELETGWEAAGGVPRGKCVRISLHWCDACSGHRRLRCKLRL